MSFALRNSQVSFNVLAAGLALAVGATIYRDHGPSIAWFSSPLSQVKMRHTGDTFTVDARIVHPDADITSRVKENVDSANLRPSSGDSPMLDTTSQSADGVCVDVKDLSSSIKATEIFRHIPKVFRHVGPRFYGVAWSLQQVTPSVWFNSGTDCSEISQLRTWASDTCTSFECESGDMPSALVASPAGDIESLYGLDPLLLIRWLTFLTPEEMPSQDPHCIYVDIPTPSLDLGDLFLVDEPLDSSCILHRLPGQAYHLCVEIPTPRLDFGDNLFLDLQNANLLLNDPPEKHGVALGSSEESSPRALDPGGFEQIPLILLRHGLVVVLYIICSTVLALLVCLMRVLRLFGLSGAPEADTTSPSLIRDSTSRAPELLFMDVVECKDGTCVGGADEDDQSWVTSVDDSRAEVSSYGAISSVLGEESYSEDDAEADVSDTTLVELEPLSQQPRLKVLALSPRKLNRDAAVFIPRMPFLQLVANSSVQSTASRVRPARVVGKENRHRSLPTVISDIRTEEFILEAWAKSPPIDNPFRRRRRKGIGNFNVKQHFKLARRTEPIVIKAPLPTASLDVPSSNDSLSSPLCSPPYQLRSTHTIDCLRTISASSSDGWNSGSLDSIRIVPSRSLDGLQVSRS